MNSIQYDNNRVENSKENEKVGRVRRRRGSSYPINRSINRGLHERNKEGGEKKEQRIFSLLDQTVVEYPQTLATWLAVHDGQATITRATITTCTHSRSCQISARVATRPITSLLESEGKGESLLFLLGRERDERNNFWIRLGESRNRNRFLFHFYKIVAENCSFLCCVKTFLFDPGSKEKNRSKERSFPFNFDRFPYFSKDWQTKSVKTLLERIASSREFLDYNIRCYLVTEW